MDTNEIVMNNLIERLENVIGNYTRMQESLFESHHFAIQTRQELENIIEMEFDERVVRDLKEHLEQIDQKMYELTELVESEKNVLDDFRRVIESYHPCVYGPPV